MRATPRLLLALAATGWLGCGGGASSTDPRAPGAPGVSGGLSVAGGEDLGPCVEPPAGASKARPEVVAERERGLAALDAGEFVAAKAAFTKALELHPGDLASSAGQIAVDIERQKAQVRLQRDLDRIPPAVVPRPPFARFVAPATNAAPPSKVSPKLVPAGSSPNKIIDEDRWLERYGLSLPILGQGAGEVGGDVPAVVRGAQLRMALRYADHDVYTFEGSNKDTLVAVVDSDGRLAGLLDVSALVQTGFGPPEEVAWAQARGDALYLATRNMHYASESGNKNGFVTAVALRDGKLLWQSDPLVANARNFLIAGEVVVAGYGFTAEPDNIFLLARATGQTLSKTATPSSPEIFIEKGGTLFVRTYDTDLQFKFDPPLDAASKPGAPGATPVKAPAGAFSFRTGPATPAHPRAADIACWRRQGLIALERGDAHEADRLLGASLAIDPERPSSKALVGASQFLRQAQGDPDAVVLNAVEPRRLARPPFEYALVRRADVPAGPAPKLSVATEVANQITDEERFIEVHGIKPRGLRPGNAMLGTPSEVPPEIPPTFGNVGLSLAIRHPDHWVLIYGGRFVAVVRKGKVESMLDFEQYLMPDKFVDEWRQFASEDVTWAEAVGNVLFVENGGGSYAKEVFGKKGYLNAIDISTGELLWRSQPLVANSGSFVLHAGHIISGYGFTAEPDALFVIEQATGKVVSRTPVKSGPSLIVHQGGKLLVRTYDTDYVFDVR